MIYQPRTKPEIETADLAELKLIAWRLMTNVRQCGGATVAGRKVAQRRLRADGVRYYLATGTYEDGDTVQTWRTWGVVGDGSWPSISTGPHHGQDTIELVTGLSINHCAHKLGNGDARKGWAIFWSR